ncbi:MAG TPA: GDSL-type esterase/lipase family protein, partial [Planctomycetaceae bacterium]|nr:GDSL-type esterase/lipase family protein [Planctomycetaceae bacterium]
MTVSSASLFRGVLFLLVLRCVSPGVADEPAAKTPLRIITLGDSITRGVRSGVVANDTFSALLEVELRKTGRAVEVLNVGIGGERTDGALARLDKDVIAKQPDLVTIMYGTNDSYVDKGKTEPRLTRDEFAANLRQLVDRLQAANIKPVLMTEPRWGDAAVKNGAGEHPNVLLEKYLTACREVAKEKQVPLVDHFTQWTDRNASGFDVGQWTTDQCHLNPAGHKVVTAAILKVLRRDGLVDLVQPLEIRTVRADGKHNAFTALRRFQDKLWLAFRAGKDHNSQDGDIVVLKSADNGRTWQDAFRLDVVPDDRDPQFLVTDKRLFLYDAAMRGTELTTFLTYTDDGETWSKPEPVYEPRFIV